MSSVATAPLAGIHGPLPLAPRFNFFSVALDLNDPAVAAQFGIEGRWEAGVNVVPRPTQTPLGWVPCSTGTMRVKESGAGRDYISFFPFVAYIPDFCSGFGIGEEWEEFVRITEQALLATEAYAAEYQFAQGLPADDNPSLNDVGLVDLGSGATVGPIEGAALLENAIAGTARAGVIHVTAGVATSWAAAGLVYQDGSVLRMLGTGTPVIVGYGYSGTDPDAAASPSGDVEWAFATGPVFAARGEARESAGPPLQAEWMDRELNDVVYRAERLMLVGWDGALQVGVRIDRSSTP